MPSFVIEFPKLFKEENKRVPQRVKTKVYERSKRGGKIGGCEYPGCRRRLLKSEEQFHHWTKTPTARSTAFLCYDHHKKSHEYKRRTIKSFGIPIDEKTVLVPVRIPIKITPKKVKPQKKALKKRRRKKRAKTPLERLAEKAEKSVWG